MPSGVNICPVTLPAFSTTDVSLPVLTSSSHSASSPVRSILSPLGDHCAEVTSMLPGLWAGSRSTFLSPVAASYSQSTSSSPCASTYANSVPTGLQLKLDGLGPTRAFGAISIRGVMALVLGSGDGKLNVARTASTRSWLAGSALLVRASAEKLVVSSSLPIWVQTSVPSAFLAVARGQLALRHLDRRVPLRARAAEADAPVQIDLPFGAL